MKTIRGGSIAILMIILFAAGCTCVSCASPATNNDFNNGDTLNIIDSKRENMVEHKGRFFNPLLDQFVGINESDILDNIPFVLNNFFIINGVNNRDKVDVTDKFSLTHEESEFIDRVLGEVGLKLKETRDILAKNGNSMTLDAEERQGIYGPCLQNLVSVTQQEMEIFKIIFREFQDREEEFFWDIQLNQRKYSQEFIGYMNGLRSWRNNFKNAWFKSFQIIDDYELGECVLFRFEKKGFTFLGSDYYFEAAEKAKNLPFIKSSNIGEDDRRPLTKEEMEELRLNVAKQDLLNTIRWTVVMLNPKTNDYFGVIVRHNPDFDTTQENQEFGNIVEIYYLGYGEKPLNILQEAFNNLPLVIRWRGKDGKLYMVWNPGIIYPLDWVPYISNSLY